MKISHGIEYIAFWLLVKAVQLMPGRLADKIAIGLGWLSYKILTSRRRIAQDNLKRAFGDEKSDEEYDRIVRQVFVNVARDVIEFARQPVIGLEKIHKYVVEQIGREHIDNVLKEKKGLMFVTGHIGSGELLGGWLATQYPMDFVVGKQHNPHVDRMFNSFRSAFGVGLIPVGLTARHVIKSLKENRIVALMSDQHSATGGTVVQFFGRPASTPKGPAAFAVKTGCPVIFGALLRERYDRFRAIIMPPIYPPNSGDKEKDVNYITQQYTSQLEELIRKQPEQWMWTHRRWKLD